MKSKTFCLSAFIFGFAALCFVMATLNAADPDVASAQNLTQSIALSSINLEYTGYETTYQYDRSDPTRQTSGFFVIFTDKNKLTRIRCGFEDQRAGMRFFDLVRQNIDREGSLDGTAWTQGGYIHNNCHLRFL